LVAPPVGLEDSTHATGDATKLFLFFLSGPPQKVAYYGEASEFARQDG
jgi:hypothetical protein